MNQNYNWMLGSNGDWMSPSNWIGNFSTGNFSNNGDSDNNDTAIFATGSDTIYAVTSSASARVGTLIVSHDTVSFRQLHLQYFGGNPYSGLQIGITNSARVDVTYYSSWNGGTWSDEHSFLTVDNHSTLSTDSSITNFLLRVTNYSSVTVSGAYANLIYDAARGQPTANNESMVDKTSSMFVFDGAHVSGALLDNRGSIDVSGAGSTLTNTDVAEHSTNEAGAKILGSNGGTLAGTVINAGVIEATKGTFRVTASVVNNNLAGLGPGSFQIDHFSVLEMGNNTNQVISFLADAELIIDKGFMVHGLIKGFTTGDTIDFVDQAALPGQGAPAINVHAGLNDTSIVDFTQGRYVVQEVKLQGSYSSANLYAQSNGHGGTVVGYGQVSGSLHIS